MMKSYLVAFGAMVMVATPAGAQPVTIIPKPQVNWTTGMRHVEQVQIALPAAVLSIRSGGPRDGKLNVNQLRGGGDCKAMAAVRDGVLYIGEETEVNRVVPPPVAIAGAQLTEGAAAAVALTPSANAKDGVTASLPPRLETRTGGGCVYEVVLDLQRAAELNITVPGEAQVEIERWADAVTARLGTGFVAFGEVGDFDLECRNCDFGGEGLNGALRYRIGIGTVGITRLTDSVDGVSRGDVVLLWRKMDAHSKVAVTSSAGDVAVGLPSSRIALSLHAPKGEIYSKRLTLAGGVPVNITAEAGTIRVRN